MTDFGGVFLNEINKLRYILEESMQETLGLELGAGAYELMNFHR